MLQQQNYEKGVVSDGGKQFAQVIHSHSRPTTDYRGKPFENRRNLRHSYVHFYVPRREIVWSSRSSRNLKQ